MAGRPWLSVASSAQPRTAPVRLHPFKRSRRVTGVTLADQQRAMTRTGLPAVNKQLRRQDSSAAACNVSSGMRLFIRQPLARRRILCRAATRSLPAIMR